MKRFMRGTVETANHESLMDNTLRLRSKKWHAYCNTFSQPQKRVSSSQLARCFFASLALLLTLLVSSAPLSVAADDRGTVGLVVRQLFAEKEPNHRGVLAVMHVVEDSPAAKAGIHCSDFITAINGVPVPGREFSDILNKDLKGPVGGTVRLTIARFDGSNRRSLLSARRCRRM